MGVSSHIDWNEVLATRACMYLCMHVPLPAALRRNTNFVGTVALKRRESTVNRLLTDDTVTVAAPR